MASAKDIVLSPIDRKAADALIKRVHYSGKVVNNSQLHIGVFLGGKLEGAMQFGPSLDKRKIQGLVSGTAWHEFIELNRMAFSDALPRNSESRALSIAMRLMRKHAPQVKWVITFADATQCGDGTIYRAAGFVLTGVTKNSQVFVLPDGSQVAGNAFQSHLSTRRQVIGRANAASSEKITDTGNSSTRLLRAIGGKTLEGFQLRYLYFIDKTARARLTVPELPYSVIADMQAGMYKGVKRAADVSRDTAGVQPEEGGSTPTQPLNEVNGMKS